MQFLKHAQAIHIPRICSPKFHIYKYSMERLTLYLH